MRWLAALALATLVANDAHAANECRIIQTRFKPADDLQIVVWLEDAAGNFVATMYVTDAVGRRGIGNRPGRFDFNSGPLWPYGRRITTFPVWAHRHGDTFPAIVFQNGDENNLSHPSLQSSHDNYFCRPLQPGAAGWDTGTCATPNTDTDKGKVDPSTVSLYPPRDDLEMEVGVDDPVVEMFAQMNPFDMISGATPPADLPYTLTWSMPQDLPSGEYVLWAEVSKEFDPNATYNATSYPAPFGIPWAEYGEPYRGQPSVVYKVPFTIGTSTSTAMVSEYAGYGDPDGLDGNVRAPDATIDSATPGSGAARFLLDTDGTDTFRLHVLARPEMDGGEPGAASELEAVRVDPRGALVSFVAPGDDGAVGVVTGYEIRYRAGEPITDDNFAASPPVRALPTPDEPGQVQLLELDGLLPRTLYYVGVRAFDDCHNVGPLVTTSFVTPEPTNGEVDACFVATAAYGSPLATEVSTLRAFRDRVLRQSVLGELFVETYYTVGPAFSTNIGHSDLLRQAARDQLAPLVELVK